MSRLPARPNVAQLRNQAKDLVKLRKADDPSFRLADAQRELAREYEFPSWPKLIKHVQRLEIRPSLHAAIRAGDLATVRSLVESDPGAAESVTGGENDVPIQVAARNNQLEIVRYLRPIGDPDLQHAFSRAAMSGHADVMRYLIAEGADPNGPYARGSEDYGPPMAAVAEVQNAHAMRVLLEMGGQLEWTLPSGERRTPVGMLLATYQRSPKSKQECLAVCAEHGFVLPDTPTMALHRGDFVRLGEWLRQNPGLLSQRFNDAEIFPPELGIAPGQGLSAAPIDGSTLLHQAVEWDDLDAVRYLLTAGADPNARAAGDADGWNDHPPIFNAAVTMGQRTDAMARTLVEAGADASLRARLRKSYVGDDYRLETESITAAELAALDVPFWMKNEAAAGYLANLTPTV